MKRIGLTGGIASGKSTLAHTLQGWGLPVLDADEVVHQMYQTDTELQDNIVRVFGPDVMSDAPAASLGQRCIDRKKLGACVFSDVEKRRLLESWIHPTVRRAITTFFDTAARQQPSPPLAVAVIPLLFESNMQALFDAVWLVACPPAQQMARLMTHRGLSQAEAQARLESQMPLSQKIPLATTVIDNSSTTEAALDQLRALVYPLALPTQLLDAVAQLLAAYPLPTQAYEQLNAIRNWLNHYVAGYELYLEDVWNDHVPGQTWFEYILRSMATYNESPMLGYDVYLNHQDSKGVWHLDEYQHSKSLLGQGQAILDFIVANGWRGWRCPPPPST